MRYHRLVTCPRCDMWAEKTETIEAIELFGSPYRICPKCKKIYFDPEYQEPAIAAYFDQGERFFWKYIFIDQDKYHREQLDLLEGRAGEQSSELKESLERLSDRKYLDALRARGVHVPDYFYQRLPADVEGSFAEQEGVLEVREVRITRSRF